MHLHAMFRLAFAFILIGATSACGRKSFGELRTVTVCNKKRCDPVDPIDEIMPEGEQALLYYSSESGFRFLKRLLNPTYTIEDEEPAHVAGDASKAFQPKSVFGSASFADVISTYIDKLTPAMLEKMMADYFGPTDREPIRIAVNTTQKFQQIHGFGGAFTDAAGFNILELPQELQERLLEDYYGPTGIGYSVGRVPISSTDFSTHVYSYNDVAGDVEMKRFSLKEDDHKYKIPFIQKALKLTNNELKLFSSIWSSPAWMKDNNKMTNGGSLLKEYRQAFANYFERFFEEYNKQGISFWATTVVNELNMGPPGWRWQTMKFTAEEERDFVGYYLGPTLKANPVTANVTIMGLDDNFPGMDKWIDTALADSVAAKYYGGFGLHWYYNDYGYGSPIPTLQAMHERHPDKFIFATEACAMFEEGTGPSPGYWTNALLYANDIIDDLNNYVTGWTDWNIALDMKGGPNWINNRVDSPILVNSAESEYYRQPTFYAMGHFSKFVRPGSFRVASTVTNGNANVQSIAFRVPNGNTVVVLHNKDGTRAHTFTVFDVAKEDVQYKVQMEPRSLATLIF